MELPLAVGLLPDYPCDERMLLLFAATVVFLTCFCALLFWLSTVIPLPNVNLNGRFPIGGYFVKSPESQNPGLKKDKSAPLGFFALVILIASMVAPFSHAQIRVIATDTSIIGTSCYLASSYRDVFDRATAHITYEYGYRKYHRRDDWLEIRQNGNKPLIIPLLHSPYLRNLAKVAPEAIRAYFSQMRTDGQTVPAGFG